LFLQRSLSNAVGNRQKIATQQIAKLQVNTVKINNEKQKQNI